MKMLLKTILFLFAATLMTACGEEEYVYPDLITEMTCLKTNSNGFGTQIITDEGKIWHLQEGNRPNKLKADTIYRVVSRFAPLTNSNATQATAKAYAFHSVIAPLPKSANSFNSIHTDPVSIQSIWRSGDYLNMVLQIKVKDQEHDLTFVENGITADANGFQTLSLTLYHNRNNDVEGFEQKFYLSVPLWHYQNKLNKGDQIEFHLNTYKEGTTTRTFTY